METLNKIFNFLYADYTKSQSLELDYLLFTYKPKDEQEKKIIEKASENMISYSIAGACLGLSLSLSLRRYLPDLFSEISVKRCVLDLFLTMGGYSVCSNLGMELALENSVEVRKNLIMTSHPDYLAVMRKKYYSYPNLFTSEKKFLLEIFTDEEYESIQNDKINPFQELFRVD